MDGVAAAFRGNSQNGAPGHGYCAGSQSWIRRAEDAVVMQGPAGGDKSKTIGMLHPTRDGHQAIAGLIKGAVGPLLEGKTLVGPAVSVCPVDAATGTRPVSVTFDSVTQEGTTSLDIRLDGTTPPYGLRAGRQAFTYDVATSGRLQRGRPGRRATRSSNWWPRA